METRTQLKSVIFTTDIFAVQGRKWRVGRVGNCPPSFWQNRRRRRAAARWQRCATLLLAHPVLGSHLRPWTPNQTELRLMVSKSIFNVDSKNVSEKFLHRCSSVLKNKKGVFFSNKFFFPPIFFFRHISKSCSVFCIL